MDYNKKEKSEAKRMGANPPQKFGQRKSEKRRRQLEKLYP